MSALPHKANINGRDCDVRFVPGTKVATSFDHLGTSHAHASEIRNLQQLTVADPDSGKVGLGLAGWRVKPH
jgi:hypothetical protein